MNITALLPSTWNPFSALAILMGTSTGDSSTALSDLIILVALYLTLVFLSAAFVLAGRSVLKVRRYKKYLPKMGAYAEHRLALRQNQRVELFSVLDHHLIEVPALDGSDHEELRRSIDAEEVFTDAELGPGLASSRIFQALPGIVTGLGVLGTFVGLQLGIGGLDLGDLTRLDSSIVPLIQGCAVAFSTSVWGVALSLLFSFFEKVLQDIAQWHLKSLQSRIDDLIPRYVPEEAMAGLERSSRNSEHLLKGLAVAIGDEMQKAIGRLGAEIKEAVSNATMEGQGPLVEQSAQLLSSAITSELGKLKDSVDGMGQRFSDSVNSASGELTKSVQNLEPTVSTLSTVVSDTQQTVHHAVDKLSAHESVMEQMGQAALQIHHAAVSFHQMREVLEASSSSNREASKAQHEVAALSEAVISKFASVGESLQKIQPVADTLIQTVQTSQSAISSAVSKLTAHEAVMASMEKSVDKFHEAAHVFGEMKDTLSESTQQNLEAAKAQKEAATLNQEVVGKFDSVNDGLKGFGPLVEALSTSVAGSKDIVVSAVEKLNAHGDVMEGMGEAVDKLQLASQSFASMNTVFEQSIKLSTDAAVAQKSAAEMNQDVATKFAAIGENLPDAKDAIFDAARVIGTLGVPLMELKDILAKQPDVNRDIERTRSVLEQERSERLLALSNDLAKTIQKAVLEFSKVGELAEQLSNASSRLESASTGLATFGRQVEQASKNQNEASQASLAAASSNERVAKTLEPIPSNLAQLTQGLALAGDKLKVGAESSAESFRMLIQYQEKWQQGVNTGLLALKDRVQEVIQSYGGQVEGQTKLLMKEWSEEVTRCLKTYETQVETLDGNLEELQRAITKFKNPG